jgi:hypothetical protein
LHLFAENYRIQQKLVESLYTQVESSLEVLVAPADPLQLQQSGTSGQANAAALTNQYLTALGQLNGAQTKMYDVWLSYLATRMQLYQDLERLVMDSRGVWIDGYGYTPDLVPVPAGQFANPGNSRRLSRDGGALGHQRREHDAGVDGGASAQGVAPAPGISLLPPVGVER